MARCLLEPSAAWSRPHPQARQGTLRWESRSSRCLAAMSRPQELHRHRKRLEGFGKDVQKGDPRTLAACRDLLKDDDWYARKTAVDVIGRVANPGDEDQLSTLY